MASDDDVVRFFAGGILAKAEVKVAARRQHHLGFLARGNPA
jgi:hypothetical protein